MSAVLIADNDRAVGQLLVEMLQRAGLTVAWVGDGQAALEHVRATLPQVLVCDLDMPILPGVELLEALHRDGVQLQVVVVSGYLDAAVLERLGRLPFVRETLRKPFDLLQFADLVKRLCADRDGDSSAAAAQD